MSKKTQTIELNPRLGFSGAENLKAAIIEAGDVGIILDASKVRHIGAPCLAVLLSAVRDCKSKTRKMNIDAPSDAFIAGLSLLGIELSQINESGANDAN